jgi:uncharacterized damage-inducible protein DinB
MPHSRTTAAPRRRSWSCRTGLLHGSAARTETCKALGTVGGVQLSQETTAAYVQHALGQMLALVELLDEELLNVRPVGDGTNSVAALVVHCCAVTEFWLGHVALGRPSARDRAAEFNANATPTACRELVESALKQATLDLARLEQGKGVSSPLRADVPGDGSDAAVALHVVEELFQHLGQMELTKDVLLRDA